jgi:hypothetical protein
MTDIDSLSPRAISRLIEREYGYRVDEKTIRNRRRHGKRGEALLIPAKMKGGKVAHEKHRANKRFKRDLWKLIASWKRPEDVSILEDIRRENLEKLLERGV